MTLQDLLQKARERLDDALPDAAYVPVGEDADVDARWKTTELTSYLNQAEREACLRARLIVDSSTASVCNLDIATGTARYSVSPLILAIVRFKVAGLDNPLKRVSQDYLDENYPGWEEDTGEPRCYVFDDSQNEVVLDKLPLVDYTGSTLTVKRLPLADMTYASDSPEIPALYHLDLLHWVERLAYLKRDAETFSKDRSDAAEERFIRVFGPRHKASDLELLRRGSSRRARAHFL